MSHKPATRTTLACAARKLSHESSQPHNPKTAYRRNHVNELWEPAGKEQQ